MDDNINDYLRKIEVKHENMHSHDPDKEIGILFCYFISFLFHFSC